MADDDYLSDLPLPGWGHLEPGFVFSHLGVGVAGGGHILPREQCIRNLSSLLR